MRSKSFLGWSVAGILASAVVALVTLAGGFTKTAPLQATQPEPCCSAADCCPECIACCAVDECCEACLLCCLEMGCDPSGCCPAPAVTSQPKAGTASIHCAGGSCCE